MVVWLLSALASASTGVRAQLVAAESGVGAHDERRAPATPVDPAALSDEARAWLSAAVQDHGTPEERFDALLAALSARGLTPDATSRTGEEVFRTRRYNCLGLAHLLVPLARELGVDARYVRIESLAAPVDLGDTVVISGHVAAAFGSPAHTRVVDPVPTTDEELRGAVALTDAQAAALYHVNRGAEITLAGDPDAALPWFDLARQLAPEVPELWVDEGIALQRLGRVDEAVADWRRAIELDPGHGPAWRNLAGALASSGDPEAARAVLLELSGPEARDPLTHLARGDAWARIGEARLALRAYARARWAGAPLATVAAARGDALLDLGHPRRAARALRSAERRAPDLPRVRRLARRLGGGAPSDPDAG